MTQQDSGQQSASELSTAELLNRLSTQVSELVRDEMALATEELKRKGAKTGVGAGLSGAGALLALYGLGALILAAIAGLAVVLPAWASALIIGGILLVIAGILAASGIGQVKKATPLTPEHAVDSTKRDVEAVKESVRR